MSLRERFEEKVTYEPNSGCWLWLGCCDARLYGAIRSGRGGPMIKAYRVAYELNVGSVAKGLELDHTCRNPNCVNPAHLEPVTHKENCRRGAAVAGNFGKANRDKTHCRRGHALADGNLYLAPDGTRKCRACRRNYMRVYGNGLS